MLLFCCLIGFAMAALAAPADPLIASLQTKLAESGHDPGPADGVWGKNTEQALRAYQQQEGLTVNGRLDQTTARRLDLDLGAVDQSPGDIVDLLAAGKITVETEWSGIQQVLVKVKPRVPYPVSVRIPVGTFFVSRNAASQNMVATGAETIRLTDDDWVTVAMPAACANRPRNVPDGGDSFRVRRSPKQADLGRLMPVLDRAKVGFAVRQAAVWIVTDNADYADLGILIQNMGSRAIDASDAARAMRLCDEAGIDVERKAIWRDRKQIAAQLGDSDLKRWLEQK
ncbi:Peptidoglycan-binding domain 1 protein [Thiocapsa marina 5811]|uniref:Peptidoglycan-binding domain 1 protein n=2 Tax=Thiocapsa marina TaxID=244573 RepID=F9UHV6_9GAMM|nr:Peptidoglycan-binding domain 1 protein [Thiocapsa marina 5811]